MPPDVDALRKPFREWAREMSGKAPLYTQIVRHIVHDDDVLSVLLANPWPEQRVPVLLFAAVHDLILQDPDLLSLIHI